MLGHDTALVVESNSNTQFSDPYSLALVPKERFH